MHCYQQIMASVKSESLARATDHSLYFKFIIVTTVYCTRAPTFVPTCI